MEMIAVLPRYNTSCNQCQVPYYIHAAMLGTYPGIKMSYIHDLQQLWHSSPSFGLS